MKNLYSVVLYVQMDIEYNRDETKLNSAIRQAINKTIKPEITKEGDGVNVLHVRAMDPDCGAIHREWGNL